MVNLASPNAVWSRRNSMRLLLGALLAMMALATLAPMLWHTPDAAGPGGPGAAGTVGPRLYQSSLTRAKLAAAAAAASASRSHSPSPAPSPALSPAPATPSSAAAVPTSSSPSSTPAPAHPRLDPGPAPASESAPHATPLTPIQVAPAADAVQESAEESAMRHQQVQAAEAERVQREQREKQLRMQQQKEAHEQRLVRQQWEERQQQERQQEQQRLQQKEKLQPRLRRRRVPSAQQAPSVPAASHPWAPSVPTPSPVAAAASSPSPYSSTWFHPRCPAQLHAPGFHVPQLLQPLTADASVSLTASLLASESKQESGAPSAPFPGAPPPPSIPAPGDGAAQMPQPLKMRPSPRPVRRKKWVQGVRVGGVGSNQGAKGKVGVEFAEPTLDASSSYALIQRLAARAMSRQDRAPPAEATAGMHPALVARMEGDLQGAQTPGLRTPTLFGRSTFTWASMESPNLPPSSSSSSTSSSSPHSYSSSSSSSQKKPFLTDALARSADLTLVSFFEGRLHLWGLPHDEMEANVLPEWFPPLAQMAGARRNLKPGATLIIPEVVFHPDHPLPLHRCMEWVEESSFFFYAEDSSPAQGSAGKIKEHAYRVHNEMVLPLFGHLRSLGLLGEVEEAQGHKRRLYRMDDDRATSVDEDTSTNGDNPAGSSSRPRTPSLSQSLLSQLFQDNIHPRSQLDRATADEMVCFRHVRWGRGALPGAELKTYPLSKDCASMQSASVWPLPPSIAANLIGRGMSVRAVALAGAKDGERALLPTSHFVPLGGRIGAGDRIVYQQWLWRSMALPVRVRQGWSLSGERVAWVRGEADKHVPAAGALGHDTAESGISVFGESGARDGLHGPDEDDAVITACRARQRGPNVVWMHTDPADVDAMGREVQEQGTKQPARGRNSSSLGIHNQAQLLEWMQYSPYWDARVTQCCGGGGGATPLPLPLPALVDRLRMADILIGVHSPALALLLYLPAGGMVVELQTGHTAAPSLYPALSRGLNHLHVEIDLRGVEQEQVQQSSEGGGEGVGALRLSESFGQRLIAEAAAQWKRHYPCSWDEEQERQSWHDQNTPFRSRFPMADAMGDRQEHPWEEKRKGDY